MDRSLTYTVNNLNQYNSAAGTTPATFAHDLNGNMTSAIDSGGAGGSYVYDALNRLTSASGTNSATLVYGPKGRLIETTAGGVTTEFLYDGGALIAEYVGSAVINRYAHGGGVDDPIVWNYGDRCNNPQTSGVVPSGSGYRNKFGMTGCGLRALEHLTIASS